jgi:hypothetical protein
MAWDQFKGITQAGPPVFIRLLWQEQVLVCLPQGTG